MSLSDIQDKIISDAKEKSKQIIEDSEDKIRQISRDFLAEKDNLEKKLNKELEKNLKDNDNRHASALERESKLKKESLKRSVIDGVFEKSLGKLEGCSEDDFSKFAEKILSSLPDDISGDVLVLSKRVSAVKHVAKKHSGLSVKEDDSVKDGMIISGKGFQYDFTFENLLRGQKQNLELELSKILFSE